MASAARNSELIERNDEQIAALTVTVAQHSEQIAGLMATAARHSDQIERNSEQIAALTVTVARQGEQISQLGRDMQEGFRMLRDSDQLLLEEMRRGNRQLLQALNHTHDTEGEPAFRLPVAAE